MCLQALGGVGFALFLSRAYQLVHDNVPLLELLDRSAFERHILRFRPPALSVVEGATWLYQSLFSSVLIGTENIPLAELKAGRPLLFVSNHPILGFDFPILLTSLYKELGVFLRALTDHSHWQIPGSATVMRDILGAVEGTQVLSMFVSWSVVDFE